MLSMYLLKPSGEWYKAKIIRLSNRLRAQSVEVITSEEEEQREESSDPDLLDWLERDHGVHQKMRARQMQTVRVLALLGWSVYARA